MGDYVICTLLVLAGFIIVKVCEIFLLKRLKTWVEKTVTDIDDFIIGLVSKIALPFLYFSVFFLSLNVLTIAPCLNKLIDSIWMAVLTFSIVRFAIALVKYGLDFYLLKRGSQEVLKHSLNGILVVIKVVIWGLAVASFLDNLGFKISAVIAGLGIGGVAVALAAQAVLGDLFSYFAILFDHPFAVGDFIIVGDYMGTVEYVGIKTARIRSLGGE